MAEQISIVICAATIIVASFILYFVGNLRPKSPPENKETVSQTVTENIVKPVQIEVPSKQVEKKSDKGDTHKKPKINLPAIKNQFKLLNAVEDKIKDTCKCFAKEIGGHSMAIIGIKDIQHLIIYLTRMNLLFIYSIFISYEWEYGCYHW